MDEIKKVTNDEFNDIASQLPDGLFLAVLKTKKFK